MAITQQFDAQMQAHYDSASYRVDYLPELLINVLVDVLAVDGASMSLLNDELRMPLGGNDAHARMAEMVQFTLGDGPCIDTYRTGQPAALGSDDLDMRWPVYFDALTASTPYRAVASIPLAMGEQTIGALDLYSIDPARPGPAGVTDAVVLGRAAVRALIGGAQAGTEEPEDWRALQRLDNEHTHRRSITWIAIGLIGRAVDLSNTEALDRIRAYAVSRGQVLDDVTYDLASHNLEADELLAAVRPEGDR